ncbi:glycosyltransferase family 4 protein [Roseivirga sp. BDSF3-8]|uniref:glycosyltransferase family 4 protein n=1 Tax=Roseivirga sp. BDSF3-8 TaxID=3241598 RepID=UPI003531B2F0
MKVVILTQYFPPEIGAPQNRLVEMAKGLVERGCDVRVLTAMPNYPTGRIFDGYKGRFSTTEPLGTDSLSRDIQVYRYWLYPSNSPNKIPRILSMLSFSATSFFGLGKLKKWKPDYVISESPPLTLALTGLYLAKWSGASHIMNVSDLWPLSAKELGAISDGFVYRQFERLEHFLYRKSFAVTGQSQQILQHIAERQATRTHLFRNGVDYTRFSTLENKPVSEPRKIVYAGLIGVAQGLKRYVKELKFADRNLELHIYGDGAEKDEVENYIKANPDCGIIMHGRVSRDRIPALLSAHDGIFAPLTRPIFGAVPSKIYEGMAAGVPILFAGGGEGQELIDRFEAGFSAEPGNIEDMQSMLDNFASNDEEQLRRKGENGRKAAREVFDRRIQLDSFANFLNKNINS